MSEIVEEQWRPAPGYEGRFEVSNLGRVYSRPASKFNKPRILKPWRQYGYFYVHLTDAAGKAKKHRVNRLVLMTFDRAPLPGEHARHLNGDQEDNRLANLAWGTASENQQDNLRLGTNANARVTHCPAGHEYTPENTLPGRRLSIEGRARRCRLCKAASRRRSNARIVAPAAGDGDPRHGSVNGYKRGCRCADCRAAQTAQRSEYRARTGRR